MILSPIIRFTHQHLHEICLYARGKQTHGKFNAIPFHDTKEVSPRGHGDANKSPDLATLQISAFQCEFSKVRSFLWQK